MADSADITALLKAADAIEKRTTRPGAFWVRVITNVLRDAARKIARGDWPMRSNEAEPEHDQSSPKHGIQHSFDYIRRTYGGRR
jgi:hypothetical protein